MRCMRIVLQLVLCVVPMLSPLVASAAPKPIDEAIPTLAFADFYKRPIGAQGLEPSPRLLASADSRVQLSGYVARGAEPQPGVAILAPVPVVLGDEDEGLADDLPAAVAYLHWTEPDVAAAIAACAGAMRVTGRLELGRRSEADGRSSFVRLVADRVQCAR